jgi:1-pyrroline-5-carboxylate dehydrogenase
MSEPFRNEPLLDFSTASRADAMRKSIEHVRSRLGASYPLVIDGHHVVSAATATFSSINPARPDEVIGVHITATPEHVSQAIDGAAAAFPEWSRTPVQQRIDCLLKTADVIQRRRAEFTAMLILEVGKPWTEADGEVAEAMDLLRWYAHQMDRLASSQHLTPIAGEDAEYFYVALGVGAIISPWNFPLAITTGMTSAALVAGNCVVVKPASNSATTVAWLVDALHEGGVPGPVLSYVTGSGSAIGDALVEDRQVRFIAFTGSREVGIRIHERAAVVGPGQIWLKRALLEMGGKNAVVVDETADLDAAALGIVQSAFSYQGQKCSAGSRAVVVESIQVSLLEKVVALALELNVGDPADRETSIGPVIDANAYAKINDYIRKGALEAHLAYSGDIPQSDGYFIRPTIFSAVPPGSTIAQEEIFGPVLAVIPAQDLADALSIANGTPFGLTGALYSRNPDAVADARSRFHVGNLYINRESTGALMGVHPFGGFNMSGTDSKAGGPDYLLFFMQGKSVGERLIDGQRVGASLAHARTH